MVGDPTTKHLPCSQGNASSNPSGFLYMNGPLAQDREVGCLNNKVTTIVELWQARLGSLLTNFALGSVSKNNLFPQ